MVNRSVFQDTCLVDNKQATQCDAGILNKNIIVGCDLLVEIGKQWKVYTLNAAVFAFDLRPRRMGEFGIDRRADDLRLAFSKIFDAVRKRKNFRRTDEGEIQGIKKQN